MGQSVLFTDSDHGLFVLDIPCSLESVNDGGRIFSSLPRNEPYITPEPKGGKREAFGARISVEEKRYYTEIQVAIEQKLNLLRNKHGLSRWCLPRVLRSTGDGEQQQPPLVEYKQDVIPVVVLAPQQNHFQTSSDIQNVLVVNQLMASTKISITKQDHLFIPRESSFIWCKIEQASLILASFERCTGIEVLFDVVLMDPPWSNRSVRHAKVYLTADAQKLEPFELALRLLPHYLTELGRVAVWITNKWKIRQTVLSSMTERGFVLTEQWIWTKVTMEGQPVTPVDGQWRKPYEILLVFQRAPHTIIPSMRYLFAVPDLHSRKPNLKSVFDILFEPRRVLEVFARNLTAGWISIGDETLKFQNVKLWSLNEDP